MTEVALKTIQSLLTSVFKCSEKHPVNTIIFIVILTGVISIFNTGNTMERKYFKSETGSTF